MAYIIILFFVLTFLLVVYEDFMGKTKLPMYMLLGLGLILLAGLREVGIDPDSENYAELYRNYYNSDNMIIGVEYSYIVISALLNMLTDDPHAIFLFYAFFGLSLKFLAFRQLSEYWFLPVLVYIGYYYNLHEVTQIRTGILSGFFLLSIKPMVEGKKKTALALILIGSLFHISGLALLPILFLKPTAPGKKMRLLWASAIPMGYLFFLAGMGIVMTFGESLPYIGSKLVLYQQGVEKGIMRVNVNVFSPIQLFTIFLYGYLLYFYDTIVEKNKYFPLMMKIFTIGLVCFPVFAFIPVMAQRVSYLLNIVDIILFSNIVYTIKPKIAGKLVVAAVALLLLNYGLGFIEFSLFWEV